MPHARHFQMEFKIVDEEDNVVHKGKKLNVRMGVKSINDFVITKLGERRLREWATGKQ